MSPSFRDLETFSSCLDLLLYCPRNAAINRELLS